MMWQDGLLSGRYEASSHANNLAIVCVNWVGDITTSGTTLTWRMSHAIGRLCC